jgi:hypothetical protein
MPIPPSILVGPAKPAWARSLVRLLPTTCRVSRSASRQAFVRALRANAPSVIVLFDVDAEGIPNEPLLRVCAKYHPTSQVVFVHSGPGVRLPSDWCARPRFVSHVILTPASRTSRRLARVVAHLSACHDDQSPEASDITTRG